MLHLSSIVVCFISSQVTLTCSLRPLGPSQQQDIKELVDYVRSQMAEKRTIVLSNVSMTTKDELMGLMGLSRGAQLECSPAA